jgi:hypothetical protein
MRRSLKLQVLPDKFYILNFQLFTFFRFIGRKSSRRLEENQQRMECEGAGSGGPGMQISFIF